MHLLYRYYSFGTDIAGYFKPDTVSASIARSNFYVFLLSGGIIVRGYIRKRVVENERRKKEKNMPSDQIDGDSARIGPCSVCNLNNTENLHPKCSHLFSVPLQSSREETRLTMTGRSIYLHGRSLKRVDW